MDVPKKYPRSSEYTYEMLRSYDWEGDILNVTDAVVSKFRDATDTQVLQHYQTDFTELREFLEAKLAGKTLRPVVRGKWVEMFDSDGYPARSHWLCCSICGHVAPFGRMSDTESRTNFCPNCGADMREEP